MDYIFTLFILIRLLRSLIRLLPTKESSKRPISAPKMDYLYIKNVVRLVKIRTFAASFAQNINTLIN